MAGTITLQIDGKPVRVKWSGASTPTRDDVTDIENDYRSRMKAIKPATDAISTFGSMFGGKAGKVKAQPVKQPQPGVLDYLQTLLPAAVQPVAQAVRGNALGGASIAAKESLNSAVALDQMVSPQLAKARQVAGDTVANIIQPFGVTDEQKFIRKGISKGIQASDPTQMLGLASAGKAAMEAKPSNGGGNIGMEIAKFLADPARNTIKMLAGIDDELLRKATAGDADAMADLVGRGAAFVIQSGVGAKAVGAFKSGKSAKAALNALQDAEKAVSDSGALAHGLRGINAEKTVLKGTTPIAQFDLPAPRANAPDMPTNPQNVGTSPGQTAIPRYDNGYAQILKSRDFSLHPNERGDRFHMEPSGVIFDRLYATSITPPAANGKPWVREMLDRLNKSDYNFKDNRPPMQSWNGHTVDIGVTRREMVEQALREGKPVPPGILADYPDMGNNKLGSQRSPLEASHPTGSENLPTVDVANSTNAEVLSNAPGAKPGPQAGSETGRAGQPISPDLGEIKRTDAPGSNSQSRKPILGTSPVGEAVGATFRPNTHMGEVTPGHRAAVEATGKPLTTNETANADFQATIDQLKGNRVTSATDGVVTRTVFDDQSMTDVNTLIDTKKLKDAKGGETTLIRNKDGSWDINAISAKRTGNGLERARGNNTYGAVVDWIESSGETQFTVYNQSGQSRQALAKLVNSGRLKPLEYGGLSDDLHPRRFAIVAKADIDKLTKQKESERMKGAARFLSDPTPDHELLDPFSDIYDKRLDHAVQRALGVSEPTDGGATALLKRRYEKQFAADDGGDFANLSRQQYDDLKSEPLEPTGHVRWYRHPDGLWRPDYRRDVLGVRLNDLSPDLQAKLIEAAQSYGGNDTLRFVTREVSENARRSSKAGGIATWDTPPPGAMTVEEFIFKEGAGGKETFVPREVVRKVLRELDITPAEMDAITQELGMVTDEAAVKTIKDIATPEVRSDLTTSMASTAEVREKLGRVARDVEPQKIEQWVKDAELRKGQESGIADQLKEKPRQLSPAEEIALGRAMQNAIEARDAAIKSGDTLAYDLADAEAMKMAEALETSGSEWGRQGVARQVIIADDFSEFGIRRKWAKSADRDLTGAETKQAQSLSKDLEEARAELQRLTNVNTGLEEYILAKGKEGPKGSAVAKRADIAARRSEAINSLVNKWKESAPEPSMRSDASMGIVTALESAKRFAAVAPDVLKIAKTYVDEGIVAIEEVIAKVRTHIPDEMGMTDDELRAILAGKVKAKADAETVKSDWESLKESASRHFQNAREEIRREAATAKAEKRAADKTAAAELRKAEAAFWKDVRTREAAFQKGVKAKASAERAEYRKWWAKSSGGRTASLMDQANRLTAKIDAMDKGTWQSAGKQLADPTVVEAQVKVDALKRLVRMKEAQLVPQKVGPLGQVAGAARTSLTMGDFSAPLTQGALAGMLNPKSWFKAFGKSIGSTFKSEASYNQAVAKLMQDPNFDTILSSGIDLPAIKKGADGEFFFDTFLDKTPVVGAVKRGSQQGYDMYLTAQRISLMSSYLDTIKATGRPLDKDGIKMISEAVSVLTGKGAGQTAAGLAKADLGRALFAPSWWLSQYQAVTGRPLRHALSYGKSTGNWAPARLMAKEYAKLTAGTLGILYGVEEALTVAKSDWRVERDPRSSLFGKMYKYTDGRLVSVDLLPMQISGPLKQIFQLAPMIGAVLNKDNKASSDSYERSRVAGQTLFGKQAPLSKNLYEMGDSWDTTNAIADGKDKKYPFDKNKDPRSVEGVKNLVLGQIPISWQQLGETMGAPLNGLEKAILGVSSLAGRGANSYKSDPIKRDPRKSLIFNQ